jgi:hypothetical protein
VNQRYYFKGDWNHTRLPAITEAGAIADAFEFKLDRSAMFAYLCIDLAYGSALFCVNHLAGAAWAIQNAVAVPSILVAPVSAPCLATPGTNVWRIERDLSSGQCQAFVDGVLLGTFDCSKTQVANYRIECTGYNGTSLASCDSYLDDVKIQARW